MTNKIKSFLFCLSVVILGGIVAGIILGSERGEKGISQDLDLGTPAVTSPTKVVQEIPPSYKIEDVPYYGEKNFCYGASAMMILKYYGFSEEEVSNFKKIVKTKGKGGPPDIFLGFRDLGLENKVFIAYSQDYDSRYAQFYSEMLEQIKGQKLVLEDEASALEHLKKLVSYNIPVIALIQQGNHYVVVYSYDQDYIYINDPDPDIGVRTVALVDFLAEWKDYKQDVSGNIGFPGEYGMIWLDKE